MKFKFLGSSGQEVQIGKGKKFGMYTCTNCFVSQKVQIFGERSILMKCILFGCLSGDIQFLIFNNFCILGGVRLKYHIL